MKKISVEYAHIYTNSKISEEHELSLQVLKELDTSESSLVVLVDDYSFPDPTFDYVEFTHWLSENGHQPDIVMRESQLMPVCDQLLQVMDDSDLKREIIQYIQTKKYPCSLFIAGWYLLRLGVLKDSSFPDFEVCENLINILPESFKSFEDKGIEIIKASPYADKVNNIENRYFQGRPLI